MDAFCATDLYDGAVAVAGICAVVVVMILGGCSSQIDFPRVGTWYVGAVVGGLACAANSISSVSAVFLKVSLTDNPPFNSGYVLNFLALDIIVESVDFFLIQVFQ